MSVEKLGKSKQLEELHKHGGNNRAISTAKGRVDGRVARFIREVGMAEEILAKELGPDLASKVKRLSGVEKFQLVKKLRDMGISSAPAISKVLRLSGQDLRRLNIIYGCDELDVLGTGHAIEDKARMMAMAADREHAEKLGTMAMQPSKPILVKEIQAAAWFHNLCSDLGNYVYRKLARYVDWEQEDLKDPDRAFKKLIGIFDGMLELREDAKALEKLKTENELLDILSSYLLNVFAKACDCLERYDNMFKLLTEEIPQILCSSCKERVMAKLTAYEACSSLT
jgi:hypothetical protein